jgi:hypothetical protein
MSYDRSTQADPIPQRADTPVQREEETLSETVRGLQAMSWTRAQVERLGKLQLQIQTLIQEVGNDAPGLDILVSINEQMADVQQVGLEEVEQIEHKREAREFVDALGEWSRG